ncbi:MAG: ABC transporter ATP-binding protein [Acidimicrobiia bacterium]
MTSSLEFRSIEVSYGRRTVLHGMSVGVHAGGWLGVVGPNGAGKSTLLRTVAGAVDYAGAVLVDGEAIDGLSQRERATLVAYVPQRPVYPQGMAVFDYVLLGRTPYLGPLAAESHEDITSVWEALDVLRLVDFADRDVATLSGGETQRVSLARVLAQRAPIVVLDEATASLDVAAQHEVLELIDQLRRERGMTVISAIHDLTAAAQFCERIALIDEGRVVGDGDPDAVLTEDLLGKVFEPSIRVIDVDGSTVIVSLRTEEASS